jgi:hypothetical protein
MSRVVILVVLALPAAFCSGVIHAQKAPLEPTPEAPHSGEKTLTKRKALKAYHGPDLKGKDGPMAKAGLDLTRLYFNYLQSRSAGTELDTDISASIQGGFVTIDAVAEPGSTSVLRRELATLGARRLKSSGRIVSGRVPIEAIPKIARLPALRFLRPSTGQTQRDVQPEAGAREKQDTETSPPSEEGSSDRATGSDLFVLGLLLGTFLFLEVTGSA